MLTPDEFLCSSKTRPGVWQSVLILDNAFGQQLFTRVSLGIVAVATRQLTPTETKTIASGFSEPNSLFASGIRVSGEKYTVLRASDSSIMAKKGACGVICSRSNQAIVLATYNDNVKPEPVNTVVESLTDYLRSVNY